ncbi:MAG TPA: LytTR family DNA-binding domain-containing protein [Chitinophagaceae bacterium]|jgi:two-component system LytT family response regulator|nr:LytTR family DNA-binding domain-containing protein [Chitinophagaceae bacterium]
MIRTVVIEDEGDSRKMLLELLHEHCRQINIVAEADSVKSGLKAIAEQKPQLVFLDIELKAETSFEILAQVPEIDFELIFTTAIDQYALKAIKFCEIDYLLKPIDLSELQITVAKAEKRLNPEYLNKNLEALLNNIKSASQNNHRIALSGPAGLVFVNVRDIIYCESSGPYTKFIFEQADKIVTSSHLKEYEDLLSGYGFFRINKSYLVNLREIKKYIRGDGGQLIMSDGATLNVSKQRKESFLRIYSGS